MENGYLVELKKKTRRMISVADSPLLVAFVPAPLFSIRLVWLQLDRPAPMTGYPAMHHLAVMWFSIRQPHVPIFDLTVVSLDYCCNNITNKMIADKYSTPYPTGATTNGCDLPGRIHFVSLLLLLLLSLLGSLFVASIQHLLFQ